MVSLHNENAILSTKMDSHLTNQEKERMGLNFDNDGEWWMSYRLETSNIIWGSRKSLDAKYLTHPNLTIKAGHNVFQGLCGQLRPV